MKVTLQAEGERVTVVFSDIAAQCVVQASGSTLTEAIEAALAQFSVMREAAVNGLVALGLARLEPIGAITKDEPS